MVEREKREEKKAGNDRGFTSRETRPKQKGITMKVTPALEN
jgi:hypothetical protein